MIAAGDVYERARGRYGACVVRVIEVGAAPRGRATCLIVEHDDEDVIGGVTWITEQELREEWSPARVAGRVEE